MRDNFNTRAFLRYARRLILGFLDYILTAAATLASIILIFKWGENPGDVISLFLSISFLSFAIYRISARINNIDYGDEI